MSLAPSLRRFFILTVSSGILASCAETGGVVSSSDNNVEFAAQTSSINLEIWPEIDPLPLDPEIEAKVDELLSKMTIEQKVGQVIQGDTNSLTVEDVKKYRLGSVLSGGNSAPGDKPYAETQAWLDAADAYYEASLDTEDVDVAIPIIWGIDAVHGHTNVVGGVVFPHNVGLGAANDPDLIRRIMEVTAVELNVTGHDWTFAPTLAVPQNDRWGRGYEGFSEDPEIVKSYGGVIVEGLQGVLGSDDFMDPSHVMSTAKHFLGDGGTENGIDQGDARISEQELRDIHLPGYESAIVAGTQSVMASFSSWNGVPMHGQKALMTDVLKGRMNFNGFIIGDWNGHALIPGCTSTDCPQSLNAGLDMYMAPDSWEELYESTLRHVKSGRIPMERLDDANRRILRVKLASGIFDKPKPSDRHLAGRLDLLGSAEHRAVAREAVRKSAVLLKNNGSTLPLDPAMNVHVVGPGADSIAKLAGGWTLSWQGRDLENSVFPNGESLLTAIQREVEGAGGRVTFDPEGAAVPENTDVIIAVYGEDPYAEFQGDRANVDFVPNDFETQRLEALGEGGTPIVSVFVSGRPLWTNPEINDSDAFVAAFLPGSEPAGLTDLLFQTEPDYDFTGRLSFSWPKLATQVKLNPHHEGYDPQFELGYGLSLTSDVELDVLSEESGVDGVVAQKGIFFDRGAVPQPFRLNVDESPIDLPYNGEAVRVVAYDRAAQEDSLRVTFEDEAIFAIASSYPLDYAREANGAMELSFMAKSLSGPNTVSVGAGCVEMEDCENFHRVELNEDWAETRISLRCAAAVDVDLQFLKSGFALKGMRGDDVALSDIKLEQESLGSIRCD